MEDTSLDEFTQTNSEESGDKNGTEQEPTTETAEADAVDSATPTFRLAPDGADCQQCERSTSRLWLDDGMFVCRNCAEW